MDVCIAYPGDLSRSYGGTERTVAFAKGLSDAGYDVGIVMPRPDDDPPALDGVELVTVPVSNGGILNQPVRATLVARRANALSRTHNAVLQFEHSSLAGIGSLVGAAGYVLDMHDLTYHSPLYADRLGGRVVQRVLRRIEHRAIRAADAVIAVSSQMTDILAEEVPEAPRAVAIPNGYPPAAVAAVRDVETVPGRAVFMGTLHGKVDLDALVAAGRQPAVDELVVVGGGPKYDELARRAPADVTLRGQQPQAEALRVAATGELLVSPYVQSPAIRASSPIKIYAYAAMGKPIVATPGPENIERLAEKGALLKVENARFGEGVTRVLEEDDLRKRLAEAAPTAVEDCTWSARADAYVEALAPKLA
jgi:glycosyltransferase involved in cell wall biosynthesis